MGRKSQLTDIEKGKIEVLRKENYVIRDIANAICRSKSAVGAYIKSSTSQKMKSKPGPKSKISPRTARLLANDARKGRKTARMVWEKSGIEVSLRTVQRVLSANATLEFGHLAVRPRLTAEHVKAR